MIVLVIQPLDNLFFPYAFTNWLGDCILRCGVGKLWCSWNFILGLIIWIVWCIVSFFSHAAGQAAGLGVSGTFNTAGIPVSMFAVGATGGSPVIPSLSDWISSRLSVVLLFYVILIVCTATSITMRENGLRSLLSMTCQGILLMAFQVGQNLATLGMANPLVALARFFLLWCNVGPQSTPFQQLANLPASLVGQLGTTEGSAVFLCYFYFFILPLLSLMAVTGIAYYVNIRCYIQAKF